MSTLERELYRAIVKYRKAYHEYVKKNDLYDVVCKNDKELAMRRAQVILAATSVDITK